MDYDKDKIDEIVLALIHLTTFEDKIGNITINRTWKGYDWDVMNRLFDKGYIDDPKSKAKSVQLTNEGLQKSEELFIKYFSL